ncbi:hypothetical protein NQ314_012259, partial [Rhamnusium bicolor]
LKLLFSDFSTAQSANNRTFPEHFFFGVSTSAYQTEGAWNEDGKGENIWDFWVHNDPSHVKNGDTGDIASDSYHHFQDDIELASIDLGANLYEFSISWSRILPTGFDNEVNIKAILHYQTLIDRIITLGMTPIATLYFNDLPQPLQDIGGWTNPDMVKYFTQYARVAFKYFDRVKYWITFNEPRSTCRLGYGKGIYAPGVAIDGYADYLCAYVLIKSHAAVYHLYRDEFPDLEAKLSIAIDLEWSEPASEAEADAKAAERRNSFEFGLYANPIYLGNWPQIVIDRVGSRSANENITKSRLPTFTPEEINNIRGTSDFLATNLRYTSLVKDIPEPAFDDPGYIKDVGVEISLDPDWELSSSGNPIVPWGARKSLNWLKTTYNDPEILITGNGVADDGSTIQDYVRINFYRDYLLSILDAIYEDNVKVFGYSAYSLLDGFEWKEGYSQHYGFYQVNLTDVNKRRIRKRSVQYYYDLIKSHTIPDEITTTSTTTSTTTTTTTEPSTTPGAANRILFYPLIISVPVFSYLLL